MARPHWTVSHSRAGQRSSEGQVLRCETRRLLSNRRHGHSDRGRHERPQRTYTRMKTYEEMRARLAEQQNIFARLKMEQRDAYTNQWMEAIETKLEAAHASVGAVD